MLLADRHLSAQHLTHLLGQWRNTGPGYVALADAIRTAILTGALPTRSRLPSERDLAGALEVSRTTVSATYDRLRQEGYLHSRQGSGTVTALPDGTARSPTFGEIPDSHLLDLTKAAPSATPELMSALESASDDLRHHLGSRGLTPWGLDELRDQVAQWYINRGVPTRTDQVLITSGAQQGLNLLLGSVRRGSRVIIEHPTYPHAIDIVRGSGARPVPVPVDEEGVDPALLGATVAAVSPAAIYLIADYHNPTGTVLSASRREQVRRIGAQGEALMVVDEVFADLHIDGPPLHSLLGSGTDKQIVAVGSASKSFWSGLRVGWVRGDPALLEKLVHRRSWMDLGSPIIDQLVVLHLLRDREAILTRRRAELRHRRDLLVELIGTHLPQWSVHSPAGGLSLWAHTPQLSSTELARLGPRHGFHLVPGTAFGLDGSFDDRVRLTFAEPDEVIRAAVNRIAAATNQLRVRGSAR